MLVAPKQEEIMRAALSLFAERGFDATTVPQIAERAGVGTGTIYRYFANKEALFNALFQDCVRRLSRRLAGCCQSVGQSIREQFRQSFHLMVEYAEEDADALLFIESHSNAHYLDEESRRLFQEMLDMVRSILEQGKEQGLIRRFDSNALIGIVYGSVVQLFKLIDKGLLAKSEQLFAELEECCWRAVSR